MSIYVISQPFSVCTCLQELFEKINFSNDHDTLWLTGNLFKNLSAQEVYNTFHFIRELGKKVITVLGNHDMELLAWSEGFYKPGLDEKEIETRCEIFTTPGHAELLKWLRQRPFMHYDKSSDFIMVHAGLPAQWSLSQASTFAIEAETALSFGNQKAFFENVQKNAPRRWNAKLRGWKRLHFITSAFTRIRYCNEQGYMDFADVIPSSESTQDYLPWYQQTARITSGNNIVFDHSTWPVNNPAANIYPLAMNHVLRISDTVKLMTV